MFTLILVKIASILPRKLAKYLYIYMGIKIGTNSRIFHGFYINRPKGFQIGENSFCNYGVSCHLGAQSTSDLIIGDEVAVGPQVTFICSTHEIGDENRRAGSNQQRSIIVEDGVWIGANATILPGVTIAKGCIIGAGALVNKSTTPNGLYVGCPARRVKELS